MLLRRSLLLPKLRMPCFTRLPIWLCVTRSGSSSLRVFPIGVGAMGAQENFAYEDCVRARKTSVVRTGLSHFLQSSCRSEGIADIAPRFFVSVRPRQGIIANHMKKLSHYDKKGRVRMVDVTSKPATSRTAVAHAFVHMQRATVASIESLKSPKGSPLGSRSHRRNFRRQAHFRADSALSPPVPHARRCDGQAVPEWNRDYLGSNGHRPHRRGDGSTGGGIGCGADDLRHVQSAWNAA